MPAVLCVESGGELGVNNVYLCVQSESDDAFDSDAVATLGWRLIIRC